MIDNKIIERIFERVEKHQKAQPLENRCVFFFTSQWPYKELNKMFTDCGITYKWNNDKSYLTLEWDDLGYKKFINIIDEYKLKDDFE